MLDTFVKSYTDRTYRHPTMVRHNGMVLAFAMDERRRIRYTVLDLTSPAMASNQLDVAGWLSNPSELIFATELAHLGYGVADQTQLPVVKLGSVTPVPTGTAVRDDEKDPFLSSTARLTAAVPFQVLSDGMFVYILRQAISDPSPAVLDAAQATLTDPSAPPAAVVAARDLITDHQQMVYVLDAGGQPVLDQNGRPIPLVAGTMLVDRFVLVGDELQPKLEVRYQRSRSKGRPASSKDSLGAADLEGHPFVEPTQELKFIPGLSAGRFSALLVPTQVAEVFRWQIFAVHAGDGLLWSYTVDRSADGLFDTVGTQAYTCTDHPDVYALTAGTCSAPSITDPTQICGKDLVPMAAASGAAGSALAFSGAGDQVTLNGGGDVGDRFTLEAWIEIDAASSTNADRPLFAAVAADPAHTGPSVWISGGTKVRAGFGDGATWHETTSGDILSTGWHHLAVVFDGVVLQMYVDGGAAFASTDLNGVSPVATPVTVIGGTAHGFAGVVDEVRFWNVARGLRDVRTGMHRRLTGLEPALVSYWRLDEATGQMIYDLTGSGATGALDGPTWVTSDAPIAESVGISRSALRFDGRTVTSGVTAALYYQQENVASGYAATPKPMKQAARVMLAAATDDGIASANHIAVLDFAVAADGSLARLATEVTLAELDAPGDPGTSPNTLLDQLATLESQHAGLVDRVAGLAASVGALTQAVNGLGALVGGSTTPVTFSGDLAYLNGPAATLQMYEVHLHDLRYGGGETERSLLNQLIAATQQQIDTAMVPISAAFTSVSADLSTMQGAYRAAQADLAAAEAELVALQRAVDADIVLPMPLLHIDPAGLTVAGGVLGFVSTTDAPLLFDSALGRLALYLRGADDEFFVAYYDTFTGRPVFTVPAATGLLAFVARSAAPEMAALSIAVSAGTDAATCTLTVSLAAAPVTITETWNNVPLDAEGLAAVLNGTAPAPLFVGSLAQAVDGKVEQLVLTPGLPLPLAAGALLDVGGTTATVAVAAPRNASAISVDPIMITAGAATPVTKIAYDYAANASSTAPGTALTQGSRLVAADARSAVGAVALATATSAGTTPSCQWFADPAGTTLDFDGHATMAGVLARTALTFDGARDGVLIAPSTALSITGQVTLEAWIRPTSTDGFRNVVVHGYTLDPPAEVYLRILDGQYQVGSYDGTDHFAGAPVPAGDLGTWVHLAGAFDGSSWRLYRNGILLASTVDPNGAVAVAPGWAIGTTSDGSDRYFAGDIDDVRIWSLARNPREISEALGQRLGGTEAGLAGYFYAIGGQVHDHSSGGATPAAVGGPKPATSPPTLAELSGFDAPADLTIEAWVNPTQTVDVARLVQHQSDASTYALGLHLARTAVHLNGTSDSILIPATPALDITGQITLEAWVRAEQTDGLRDIVAHGYLLAPPSEVALRIQNGQFRVGSYNGTDHGVNVAMAPGDTNSWVHVAGVYDGAAWHVYRNGVLGGSAADPVGAVSVPGDWAIGASATGDRQFAGAIDEVRVWRVARSAAQIAAAMDQHLSGSEPGLAGLWRAGATAMRDVTPGQHTGTFRGAPTPVAGPLTAYTTFATVGTLTTETIDAIPGNTWTHVAAAYRQAYGIHAAGVGAYLDAGTGSTLDITRDLTIEVGVTFDDLGDPHGLITRGTLGDGTDQDVPYSLLAGTDGTISFAFEDTDHTLHVVQSGPAVTAGAFHRIAVTRKRNVNVETPTAAQGSTGAVVSSWDDITLYVDGSVVAASRYTGKDPGSANTSTTIGRAFGPGATEVPLRGSLADVRVWNTARAGSDLGAALKGDEVGLVAWWRLDDGIGNVAMDSKASNHAVLKGAVSWVKSPDPAASRFTTYVNGVPVPTAVIGVGTFQAADAQFTLGALGNTTPTELLRGQLEEVRVWRVQRTPEEVQDNLFRRLTGDQQDLLAYFTMDAETGGMMSDHGPRGNDLIVTNGSYILSTAPIGEDTPQVRNALLGTPTAFNGSIQSAPAVSEYADLEMDAEGMAAGVFKRCYGYVDGAGAWKLVTGFKVGDMTTEWVGQVQFAPQLIGFMEGAPPVPSENLTVQDSYADASSVSLTEATSTNYTYATSRDSGFNASFEIGASFGDKSQTFAGLVEIEAPLGLGVGEIELTSVEAASVSGGVKSTFDTSLSWLSTATTGTGLTTTRLSSLGLNGHQEAAPAHPAIGTRYVPDNTGFALVQSQTADVYALRLVHTGALIAYQMRPNPDIPKDWNIITFPMNAAYTKQGTLDGKVGLEPDVSYPQALSYSPDISYFKPIEAYALKDQIVRDAQGLATLYGQFGVDPNLLSGGSTPTLPPPVHHDLVNTYVWTASGGQFAETQQSLDSYDETVGGGYTFQGMAGGNISVDVSIFTVDVTFDLQAMFGGHLNLSVTKEANTQTSFGVSSVATPEQDITVADAHGNRVAQAGKVDAYRYMTFYLSPRSGYHDVFFNQVVDPIWLAQSNDPSAAALRQARQDAKRPPAWRILHRVTYVSRVLGPVANQAAAPLDQALQALDIQSNYELIKTLEPFVRDKAAQYVDFAAAVRRAVAMYLPDLQPHVEDILAYLVLYYGVTDAPQLSGA